MPFILTPLYYLFTHVEMSSCCPIPVLQYIFDSRQLEFCSVALLCPLRCRRRHVEQYMLPCDGRRVRKATWRTEADSRMGAYISLQLILQIEVTFLFFILTRKTVWLSILRMSVING